MNKVQKIVAGVAVAVFAVGGIATIASKGDDKHTITGLIVLTDSTSDNRDICNPTSGYDDLGDNAQATVRDESGDILGVVDVDPGTGSSQYVPGEYYGFGIYGDPSYSGSCTHTFTIKDVPKAKFYTVTVGHRKAPSYSYAEMEGNNWHVELSIGD